MLLCFLVLFNRRSTWYNPCDRRCGLIRVPKNHSTLKNPNLFGRWKAGDSPDSVEFQHTKSQVSASQAQLASA